MAQPRDEVRTDEGFAREQDAGDALAWARELFHMPSAPGGEPCVYLTGNSLGLQPKATRVAVEAELDDWARLGVGAHVHGRHPWLPAHEFVREPLARLVGALPHEVVAMNSLTVNLHLLMVSFYRPTAERHRIVIEDSAFPSDSYAVASQAAFHGYDPAEAIVRLRPREGGREGEATLRTEDVEAYLEREGRGVALVLLGAVNYLTGQWFEMERITRAARAAGCVVGWDLAHAAGNVPLRLHDWGVDFAAWCSYKYLNSGPGAVAGAFVHERHTRKVTEGRRDEGTRRSGAAETESRDVVPAMPRFAGWWGNDPATRFRMGPEFVPVASADAWQLSNPPILALAPVRASLEVFDRVGMAALRAKSLKLTAYMESLLEALPPGRVRVLTPREPGQRGAQLSVVVPGVSRGVEGMLQERGVVVDFREPDVIRAAPVPLYSTFHDVWRLVRELASILGVAGAGR
ncbi:MAG: kynureninase [Phycisphaerales bacterium]